MIYLEDKNQSNTEDSEYKIDNLIFVWGIKSGDDISGSPACLYTMNDIEIVLDTETNEYSLGFEAIYGFEDYEGDSCAYLKYLLGEFETFMDENGFDKNIKPDLCTYMSMFKRKTISELYLDFKIFVKGYLFEHDRL